MILEVDYRLLQNAVLEAAEFIDIHAALDRSQDNLVAERLKAFVRGTQLLSAETAKGNRARNIGFELSVAAAAVSAGLPVDLRPPADISIPIPAYPCFVECKRPFSRSKVGNRIREGLRPLVTRYDACPDPRSARGFLALSISRIEHGGSAYIRAVDESDLDARLNGVIDTFIFRYRHHWEERVDPRTVAVLVELRAPCVTANPSLFLIARHYGWAMIYPPGTSERQLLGSAIAESFQKVAVDRARQAPKR